MVTIREAQSEAQFIVNTIHSLNNNLTLGVDGVEGGHFVVISIAADLSVPDSSNAFRHSVSDSAIVSA